MPNPETQKTVERIRQSRAARERALAFADAVGEGSGTGGADPFAPGTIAFDRVTGQHVEVLGGTRENIILPTPRR